MENIHLEENKIMQINKPIISTVKIILKILPTVFWVLLIFGFDLPHIAIITLISAVIHESGHIIASYAVTKKLVLKSSVSGFRLKSKKNLSYKEEILIAAAGPLWNIIAFVILLPFCKSGSYLLDLGIINLFTAISNLFPIESYDGYRIIECTALMLGCGNRAIHLLRGVSFALLSLFSIIALYFMKMLDAGYWLYFIFAAILIKTVKNDKKVFFERKPEKKRDFKRFRENYSGE